MIDKELREISLLGTDRRKLNPERLPTVVADRLVEGQPAEVNLLNAITYSSFRSAMGEGLGHVDVTQVEPIIKEVKSYAPHDLSRMVSEVLEEKQYVLEPILEKVLQFVISRDEILLPDAIVGLINKGRGLSADFKSLIKEVVGLRGNRILELNPEFGFGVAKNQKEWDLVSNKERLIIFEQQRSIDSAAAIDLLRPEWASENIKSKLAFIKIISRTLDAADKNFLLEIFKDSYADVVIKRKTDMECKKLLVGCLARLGEGYILDELKIKLKPYLKSKLTKKVFKPLKKTDKFWDGAFLSQWIGLSEKNLDLAKFDYDPLYWLGEMIEILPIDFWSQLLGRNLKSTVDYFLTDKQFQVKIVDEPEPIFLSALIQNATVTRNTDLLDVLAASTHTDEANALIPLFSNPQFEKYIDTNKLWDHVGLIKLRPKKTSESWSLKFTKKYITELNKAIAKGYCYLDVQDGNAIATHFNMEAAGHLAKVDSQSQGDQWYHMWHSGLVKPIAYRININNRLSQLLSQAKTS